MMSEVGVGIYRACLRAYPADFRARHGTAMEEAFDRLLREAHRRGGARSALACLVAECANVLGTGARRRWQALVSGLLMDVRAAFRAFRARAGFTAVVLATLALGIGANTAIFSIVSGVMLKPLPYPAPDRIVRLMGIYEGGRSEPYVSYPDFHDVRAGASALDAAAAYQPWSPTLVGDGGPDLLHGMVVTQDFFRVLGVDATVGRTFLPEEDVDGHDRVVVLSYGFWQRRFGADEGIVGRSVTLNGTPHVVVGVAPARFADRLPAIGRADLWRPVGVDLADLPYRGNESYLAVARLKEGITRSRAESEVEAIMAGIAEAHPDTNLGQSMRLEPLQGAAVRDARTVLWLLLGAVGLVLAIAVVNVANLFLARAADREGDLALRAALGAGRMRLVRQILVEGLLLSGAGSLLGLGLAALIIERVVAMSAGSIPLSSEITLDGRVLAFTGSLAVLAGLVTGLAPALLQKATGIQRALQSGVTRGSTAGARHVRIRGVMVMSQVALSVVLLLGAGLLVRSLDKLSRVDPGVRTSVITFRLAPNSVRYDEAEALEVFYREVRERVEAVPGVREVAFTTGLPMTGHSACGTLFSEEEPDRFDGEDRCAEVRAVSPGFFHAMDLPMEAGRALTDDDNEGAESVAVINRTVADLLWPGQNPLGHRLATGLGGDDLKGMRLFRVVGVVPDVKQFRLDEPAPPQTYLPVAQWPRRARTVIVESDRTLEAIAPALRQAVWAVDGQIPVSELGALRDFVSDALAGPRFRTALIGAFAALALALALVGLYGVVSYSVTQREKEIAVRLAMGAPRGDVLLLVLVGAVRMVVPGILLGLGGAFALSRTLDSLLYAVSPWDPVSFVLVPLAAFAVAIAASYLPARRAVRFDPAGALRAT